jgi:hypothetical protein
LGRQHEEKEKTHVTTDNPDSTYVEVKATP